MSTLKVEQQWSGVLVETPSITGNNPSAHDQQAGSRLIPHMNDSGRQCQHNSQGKAEPKQQDGLHRAWQWAEAVCIGRQEGGSVCIPVQEWV